METRTDILSDKEIESIRVNINSKIYKYIWAFPDRDVMRIIDFSLKDYSAENKEAILKGVFYYHSKTKERDILEYISDDFYKKHVDEIEYQAQHFDYDNIDSYYDATSKGKLPLYQLLEEQQFHKTLNIGLKTAQSKYEKQLQLVLNEYKTTIDNISVQRKEEISFVHEKYTRNRDSINKKYEIELNPIYEKYGKEYGSISKQSDEILNSFFERRKNEIESISFRRDNELNSISGQYGEKEFILNLQHDEKHNVAVEKMEKALNSLFEQHELALKSIHEQSKKGCDSFVKPRERALDPVTMLEENQTKLESGSQSENKVQFEETDQFFDSILEHINGFRQKETTSGMIYSGTWTNKTCVFKGGVKTCTEKSGQF
ncbi:hypothetical protein [Providencia sp.]|uniref:hypothetical protein n=1 Tax=Providencia sp. TaxID=589 RepID=UPI0033421F26